ncbi:MAG TPA: hypothetical protein VFC46_14570 [Humisphaera sp.]|nr:hypothetical protein [Humisphaera sp.]
MGLNMNGNNYRLSWLNLRRPWVWGLAIAVSSAAGCAFVALGCCSESHGVVQSDSIVPPDIGGAGASLDQLNSALAALADKGKFAIKLDSQNRGDHGLICFTDRAGKLTLRILNNDPKAIHDYVGTVDVVFKNKERQTVPYYRDFVEIPGDAAGTERPIPAGAFLAADVVQPAVAAAKPAPASAPVACGNSARGAGMQELGTVGWNIVYGGQAVCITNHHVLSDSNNPALNHQALLDGRSVAKLYRYHPLVFATAMTSPINYWDLALASYDNNACAAAAFADCKFTYPYLMAPAGSVHPFQSFHFDGFVSKCLNHFVLQGKGKGMVQLFGKNVYFDQQLLFPLQTAPRDSGSLIIRDDQYVVGLHMYSVKGTTTDLSYSMANPLYRVPWTANGISQPPGAPAFLPAFSSVPPVAAPDCISGAPLPE